MPIKDCTCFLHVGGGISVIADILFWAGFWPSVV